MHSKGKKKKKETKEAKIILCVRSQKGGDILLVVEQET